MENIDALTGLEVVPRLAIVDNPILESTGGLFLTIGAWACPNWDPKLEPPPTPVPDGNAGLVHLDGLDSLQTHGELEIVGNPVLESVTGLLSASGDRAEVQLNSALPYTQAIELDASMLLTTCGNLDEPTRMRVRLGSRRPVIPRRSFASDLRRCDDAGVDAERAGLVASAKLGVGRLAQVPHEDRSDCSGLFAPRVAKPPSTRSDPRLTPLAFAAVLV